MNIKITIISTTLQVFIHSFIIMLALSTLLLVIILSFLCSSITSIARSDGLLDTASLREEGVRDLLLYSTSTPVSVSLPHPPKASPGHATSTPTPNPDTPEFFLDPTTYEPTSEPTSEPAIPSAEAIATHWYTSGHIFGIHSAEDAGLLALIVISIFLFLCLLGVMSHYYYFFYKKVKTEEEKELMYKYNATKGDVETPQRV